MNKIIAATAFLGCLLIACGPSDVGRTGRQQVKVIEHELTSAADFMPLQKGNSWTYAMDQIVRDTKGRQSSGTAELTFKVDKIVDQGEGKRALFKVYNKSAENSTVSFLCNSKGVYQTSLAGKDLTAPYDPPLPLIVWPSKPGQERKWAGRGYIAGLGAVGSLKSTITYKGLSDVDTPAGRMHAHRVDTVTSYTTGGKTYRSTQSMWFVPTIGLVRSLDITIGPAGVRQSDMRLKTSTRK